MDKKTRDEVRFRISQDPHAVLSKITEQHANYLYDRYRVKRGNELGLLFAIWEEQDKKLQALLNAKKISGGTCISDNITFGV